MMTLNSLKAVWLVGAVGGFVAVSICGELYNTSIVHMRPMDIRACTDYPNTFSIVTVKGERKCLAISEATRWERVNDGLQLAIVYCAAASFGPPLLLKLRRRRRKRREG